MKATVNRKMFRRWVMVILILFGLYEGKYLVSPVVVAGKVPSSRVACRVEIDRNVLPEGGRQKAVIKVTLDPPPPLENIERPAVNLSIVLDRSGSMSGQKLEKAKAAAIEALRHLGAEDIFSVVVYDHNVRTVVPARSARYVEWIERQIREIRSGGNTALFGGVSQGAAELRKNFGGRYVHRIILLSDGIANVGPSTPEDLGRLGAALIKEGISVTTVGVGTDYNEDLMTSLSRNSDGNSYFVESSADLPRIFAAELGDVLNVVAKKIHIVVECPDGVRPLTIIGREGRIRGRTVELYLNQLYGGQEKYALIEVEVPGQNSGEEIHIASVNVSYENPLTQRNETASGRVSARFSDNKAEVNKSANVEVQRDYQLNLNAIAKDRAISLSDMGKKDEAVRELKKSAGQLRYLGRKYGDEKLLDEAQEMEQQAEQIEEKGMTRKYRKSLRTDSYQMKHQQLNK
jgi:Ca-activated chloride channel family protein